MSEADVEVTFIDDATNESFGVVEMPADNLPESFECDTTLHLGDRDWNVAQAAPATRAEFSQSGKLTLRLRRIESVDPSDILYSLPSLCDPIPGLSDLPLKGDEVLLTEDDWRQVEFVSRELAHEVDAEIEQIRRIHEEFASGPGWRKLHVRSRPDRPLTSPVSLQGLATSLGLSGGWSGLTYNQAPSLIKDGYALKFGELSVYGQATAGVAHVIALTGISQVDPTNEIVPRLKQLVSDHGLDVVDWCRCARLEPDDPRFEQLFAQPT